VFKHSTTRAFDRDFVGDKNHANAARLKIALYPRPECGNVVLAPVFDRKGVSECFRRVLLWILNLAGSLKPSAQRFDRPVPHSVGGVVEHLSDHLSSDSAVATALYLHDRGDSILIEKQMIDRPSVRAVFLLGQTHLARNQNPSSGFGSFHLVTREQAGIAGQQFL
jgi:hypothetical protein